MRAILWLALGTLAGCAGTGEPMPARASDGPITSLLEPGPVWRVEGAAPAWYRAGTRAVLAELGLEFVECKWLLPGPLGGLNPLVYTPFPSILGVSVHEAAFPTELVDDLPDSLRRRLEEELDARELILVPLPAATRALSELARSERQQLELLPFGDIPFKDAGLTRRVIAVSADGLELLDGEEDRVRSASHALLAETGTEVVLRVRLRVGVLDERAVIEAGSRIDWTTREGEGRLLAVRSIMGAEDVVGSSGFFPLRGFRDEVEGAPFASEVLSMLPRYMGWALETRR